MVQSDKIVDGTCAVNHLRNKKTGFLHTVHRQHDRHHAEKVLFFENRRGYAPNAGVHFAAALSETGGVNGGQFAAQLLAFFVCGEMAVDDGIALHDRAEGENGFGAATAYRRLHFAIIPVAMIGSNIAQPIGQVIPSTRHRVG